MRDNNYKRLEENQPLMNEDDDLLDKPEYGFSLFSTHI